jgi:diguanylate cyclase (GGDEF)-like protein
MKARKTTHNLSGGGEAPGDPAEASGLSDAELTPRVRAAVERLAAENRRLRDELRRVAKQVGDLEELADKDSLTPVLNRRAFLREMSRMAAFAERSDGLCSLLYFDLDGMKSINDGRGHGAGDAALAHVAVVLVGNLRASDLVGRLGGDEFGVLLTQAGRKTALAKAKNLAAAVAARQVDWHGAGFPVRVSFGVHTLVVGETLEQALEAADRAMYAHKPRPRVNTTE